MFTFLKFKGKMKEMKLDKTQRKELGKALYDIGKLSFSGLILGQLIGKEIIVRTFLFGLIFFIICFSIGTILLKEG